MPLQIQGDQGSGRSLLIIGGGGFIGQHLAVAAKASWKVHVADQSLQGSSDGSCWIEVTSANDVHSVCERIKPSAVVNLAAISDIDRCEREPDQARAVNISGAGHVATECARRGAKLVFLSSAAVFDGSKHGYTEDDLPNPLSLYGQTKLEAEKIVREILPSAVVLRPALVLGYSGGQGTNALLNKWGDSWNSGKPVRVPTEEYRNPIDAFTLVRIILFLAAQPALNGIYHVGALDSASRYEIAQKVAKSLRHASSLIIPQTDSPPGRAPRGRDHFLLTDRIRRVCSIPLGTTDEVIRRSLNEPAEGCV
jgi:dTDP-4-dehydrorhamnose reductase